MGGRFLSANTVVALLVLFGVVSFADAWLIRSAHKIQSLCCMATPNAEIIGSGRIGAFLAEAGNAKVLGREDRIDPNLKGNPILIATRNDALDSIVENCPEERRPDLVFLQNGYLDDFLQSKGLLDNTQVLLYLSVPKKGVTPVDGVTAVNPEGLTAVTGRHAEAFAARLAARDMKCRVLSPTDYRPAMFEKLM
jgi:hypothetical protein